ncbi:unnamed protein product [Calicophoron daubneyi]|uniref:Mediator of RNA polymerase II transcription subunit 4 n=1 Tax=Calicophoron daubneyi TaxID=300641 RepID=A0AAV2U1E8_CALDB
MSTRVSTKQKLICQLEGADCLLRDIVSALTRRQGPLNLEPLVELLLDKDQQIKETLAEVETQIELQKKIDKLRMDCARSDKQINLCQLQLKKSEIILSTALYYSRQKLDAMATAVKNPVDIGELVRFAHRISASHGVIAPDNWVQGDPRRPYPNKEEIRRGYLGHLDDNGQFRPSLWDALSETAAAAASLATASATSTPCGSGTPATQSSVPNVPSHHTTVPSGAAGAGSSHGLDPAGLSGSPTMILPGVNMVSSPLTVTQANPGTWATTGSSLTSSTSSNAELSTSQSGIGRPPVTSLAAMLAGSSLGEPHSRLGAGLAPPPPPPLRTTSSQPVAGSGSGGRSGGANIPKIQSGHRPISSHSPGSSHTQQMHSGVPQFHSDGHQASGPSPRAVLSHRKRGRHRVSQIDDIETMSSESTSDSSSIDE